MLHAIYPWLAIWGQLFYVGLHCTFKEEKIRT